MKALTVWQPWASLIMIGAKPVEWRKWDYRQRNPELVDQRIVIHAGARPMKRQEVFDIKLRLQDESASLVREIAEPLIDRLLSVEKCRGVLLLSCALGTAILRKPRSVNALFKKPDSDRLDHHMFGWPLDEVTLFDEPVEIPGKQGFWNYPWEAL